MAITATLGTVALVAAAALGPAPKPSVQEAGYAGVIPARYAQYMEDAAALPGYNGWCTPVDYGMGRHEGRDIIAAEGAHFQHDGERYDLIAPDGTDLGPVPLVAPEDGTVAEVTDYSGSYGGYRVVVKLGDGSGWSVGFMHVNDPRVSAGGRVSKGQTIGYVGASESEAHAHVERLGSSGLVEASGQGCVASDGQLVYTFDKDNGFVADPAPFLGGLAAANAAQPAAGVEVRQSGVQGVVIEDAPWLQRLDRYDEIAGVLNYGAGGSSEEEEGACHVYRTFTAIREFASILGEDVQVPDVPAVCSADSFHPLQEYGDRAGLDKYIQQHISGVTLDDIIAEADARGINPAVALAIAETEHHLKRGGDHGDIYGPFQCTGCASDGIESVQGGLDHFRGNLDYTGGDYARAILSYSRGETGAERMIAALGALP